MSLTIKDIAQLAGVSPSTVSKVLNNYGEISEMTRKRSLQLLMKWATHQIFRLGHWQRKNQVSLDLSMQVKSM
ncbi:LacI family DNA-binding transcriptional regulator [Niallia circulans]